MKFNVEKFKAITSPRTPLERASHNFRMQNADWLPLSVAIAVKIRQILETKGLSQTDFASLLEATPIQVSQILSGKINFDLKTIVKIQSVLGEQIIDVYTPKKPNIDSNPYLKTPIIALP